MPLWQSRAEQTALIVEAAAAGPAAAVHVGLVAILGLIVTACGLAGSASAPVAQTVAVLLAILSVGATGATVATIDVGFAAVLRSVVAGGRAADVPHADQVDAIAAGLTGEAVGAG